jgi:hypothetical protein
MVRQEVEAAIRQTVTYRPPGQSGLEVRRSPVQPVNRTRHRPLQGAPTSLEGDER